ncbi:MAG: universal stress protein, partial [Rhodospirillales bacterium]|nr:universal stress protein [Rhodospirillales bacterium]
MSFRTILVPLDGGEHGRPAMELAFAVGRDFGAHVEVLHVRADPKAAVPLLGEGMSGAMIEEMIDIAARETDQQAATARKVFHDHCASYAIRLASTPGDEGLCASFAEEMGRDDETVARRSRLHDLVVVGRPVSGADYPSPVILNAALFESGRPVLVAPAGGGAMNRARIAVAWNGSAEGARAVTEALPFMKTAKSVYILTAESDETEGDAAPPLAAYLGWHGIKAETVAFSPAGHSVGEAILMECIKLDCGM